MREGTNLTGGLLYQLGVLQNGSGSERIEFMALRLDDANVHAESRQDLAYAVVQFASQSPAFIILHFQKPRRKITQAFISRFKLGGSFLDPFFKMVMGLAQCHLDQVA